MVVGKSEAILVADLTFHELGIVVSAATALIAILLSLYLMWMHAVHYTKPYEQRQYVLSCKHHACTNFDVASYASFSWFQFTRWRPSLVFGNTGMRYITVLYQSVMRHLPSRLSLLFSAIILLRISTVKRFTFEPPFRPHGFGR